jgi:hypothetical protein
MENIKTIGNKLASRIGDALGSDYSGKFDLDNARVWVRKSGKPSGYIAIADDGSLSVAALKTSSVSKASEWIAAEMAK